MNKLLTAVFAVATALSINWSFAEELTIGSKAPKLDVKEFVKGDAVDRFENGKVYIVELWATWCGPCKTTIPRLTKLQKKYTDLTIIGIAILEEDQTLVAPFVEEMGEKMSYRVALDNVPEGGDPKDGATVKNWMEASEQSGIPASFIVNGDGVIAWIGHPGEIDEPLAMIISGKWDLQKEALKSKEIFAQRKKLEATFKTLQALFVKFQDDGDSTELMAHLETASKELPDRADQFSLIQFQILVSPKGNSDQALALGNKLLESELGENPEALNNLAWLLVSPDRVNKADPNLLKFALKAAIKADNLSKREDSSVADTLAKVFFDNEQFDKAVETQERVIELAIGTPMENDPGMKKRLRQYKRSLDESKKDPSPKK